MTDQWSFTFLGTGTSQGIPVISCPCPTCTSEDPRDRRLRCSALISSGEHQVLIDAGPDFRYQALRAGITSLDGVLITHEHYDHVGGLDDLRPLIFRSGGAMPLLAEDRVMDDLRTRYHYAFEEQPYPGAPRFDPREISVGERLSFGDIRIEALRVIHGRLPILGYLINDQLAYITDASILPPETMDRVRDVPVLVIDMLREKPHHSHNHLSQAIEMAVNIRAGKTFFIHMSHLMGPVKEWEGDLPPGIRAAYDGLTLTFEK